MPEKREKIVFIITHAGEDPERATFPFCLANAAQSMDVDAVMLLQGTGVLLAQKGYAEHMPSVAGLSPLKTYMDSFVSNGGKMWL